MQPMHYGSWIYHDEKRGVFQVKTWNEHERQAVIHAEFRTRAAAISYHYTGQK